MPSNDKPGDTDMRQEEAPRSTSQAMMTVDIFGRRYNIRAENDANTVRTLASYVDRRMRQVSKQVAAGDLVGVAVMAALNIADDYYKTRRALEQRETDLTERTRQLGHDLTRAIESVD